MKISSAALGWVSLSVLMLMHGAVHAVEKPVAVSTDKKASTKKVTTANAPQAKSKTKVATSRQEIKSTAVQMAAGEVAADAALSPQELDIAKQVHVGRIPCELGAFVTVAADEKQPGYFVIDGKNFRYRMSPVATSTGAIRLEDPRGGAVWLQIANKSMLMNKKAGQRLADNCTSPEQVAMAELIKKNPPQNILEKNSDLPSK